MNKRGLKGNARISAIRKGSAVLWLVAAFFLLKQFGMESFGYLSLGLIFVLFLGELLTPAFFVTLQKLLGSRMRKEQYKNAETVMRNGFTFTLLTGLLTAGILTAMAEIICVYIVGQPMFFYPFLLIAPSLLFILLNNCLEGYYAGTSVNFHWGRLIQLLLFIILSEIFRAVLLPYGNKVAALLRSDDYADVYGAMSLALAFTLSALLTFLIQGGIYLSVRRQLADLARRDTSRMRESLSVSGKIFSRSVLTYLPSQALVGCFFPVQYLIWLLGQKNAEEVPHVSGALLVEYFFPFLLFLLLFGMTVVRSVSETPAMVKREDYVRLNQSILDNRHSLALTALPLSVLLCVLAEPFSRVLFAEQNRELLGIWKVAGIVVYLGVLAIYQIQVCREAGMLLECNLICLAGFIVGIAGFGILEKGDYLGFLAFPVSMLLCFGILLLASGFLLHRRFGLEEEYIRSFLYPLAAAAMSGILILAADKALGKAVGDLAILLIGMGVGILIHALLIVLLHNVNRRECKRLQGIYVIRFVGRLLGFL